MSLFSDYWRPTVLSRHARRAMALAAALAPALAQAQDGEVPPTDTDGSALEEIMVTATKRAENIQDVGVAVIAYSADDLRERGVDNIASLAETMPGVKLLESTGGGVPVVIIRGVGLQDFRINNTPTAAIYVDEVYQTSVAQAGFTMFDLERLEVLKGPQGGLYGRNTTGGAIQVISAQPSLTETSGYAEASVARFETVALESAFGGPISETLGARFAGKIVRSDSGYTSSVVSGDSHGKEDRYGLRGLLRWKATDNAEMLLKLHGGRDQSETPLLRTVPIWIAGTSPVPDIGSGAFSNFLLGSADRNVICPDLLAGMRPNPATCGTAAGTTPASQGLGSDPYSTVSNPLNQLDNEWWGASIQARVEFDAITFQSISAYDDFRVGRFTEWDATPLVIEHIDYRSTIEALSQEFRVGYEADFASLLFGLNYARDTLHEDTTLFADTGIVPLAFGTTVVEQPYRQKTEMWAGFGRLDWRFAPSTTLIVEARYTDETKDFAGGTFLVAPSVFLVLVDRSAAFGDYSGKVALEHKPADDVLLYASVSKGYKSGGFFGGFATSLAQLDPYEPETVLAYEVGVKSELVDRHVRANASAFYYDYTDLQGFGLQTTGAVQINRLTNLGDARIIGAEAEVTIAPVEWLRLAASLTYLDGEITHSTKTASDSFGLSTLNPLEGRNLTNYAKWNMGALARYERPMGESLRVALQADATYRSAQDLGYVLIPEERALFRESGYTLLGLRVSLLDADSRWDVSGWVKNLLDEAYRTTASPDSLAGFYEIYGPPMTYGVSLRYSF